MNSTESIEKPANAGVSDRNLVSISPFFIVKDLQVSITHYIERFGFQLDFQGPDDDVYYGRVSREGVGIMLKAILPVWGFEVTDADGYVIAFFQLRKA